jgi:hypothetical protein
MEGSDPFWLIQVQNSIGPNPGRPWAQGFSIRYQIGPPGKAAMNEIETFLDECADDAFFRVYPEKLNVIRSVIDKLYEPVDETPERQATCGRIREIAVVKDRTPRVRCKELFPLLLRVFEQRDRVQPSELSTALQGIAISETSSVLCTREEKSSTLDVHGAEIADSIRSLFEVMWILHGRINALELITGQIIEEIAHLHIDPQAYIQQFVERARIRPANTGRTVRERDIALEEFLKAALESGSLLKRV